MKKAMLYMACVSVLLYGLGNAADRPAETKYFATVSGTVPLKLADELARADALTHATYYVGDYDSHGQLVSAREISQGRTSLLQAYKYDASGTLVEARITDAQGRISLYRSDQAGKLQLVPGN